MQLSDKTYIIILFIMIIGLGIVTFYRFKDFRNSMKEVTIPDIEIPEITLEDITSHPGLSSQKGWVSSDKKVKLTYSEDWLEATEFLLNYALDLKVLSEDTELLLFAQKLNITHQSTAFLMVSKIPEQKTLTEITESLARVFEEEGYEVEVNVLDQSKKDSTLLTILSKDEEGSEAFSELKLLFAEDVVYLAIISTPQVDWSGVKEEANDILESFNFAY